MADRVEVHDFVQGLTQTCTSPLHELKGIVWVSELGDWTTPYSR